MAVLVLAALAATSIDGQTSKKKKTSASQSRTKKKTTKKKTAKKTTRRAVAPATPAIRSCPHL